MNLLDGLIAYWDGSYSGSTAFDIAENNDGTANNTRVFGTDGKIGKGFDFTKGNDFVNISGFSFPTGNNHRTISFWSNLKSFGSVTVRQYIMSFGTYATNQLFAFDSGIASNSSNNFRVVAFANDWNTNWMPTLNVWQHIVVTHNGTTVSLYINGVLQDSTNMTYNTVNNKNILGAWGSGGSGTGERFFVNGLIDEVMVFNRALSANEVKYLYEIQRNGSPLGQYPFNVSGNSFGGGI